MDACQNPDILRVIFYIKEILSVVFIIVPIGLIVMIGIDFFKNVTAGKEDEMKKNLSIAIKRIIYCVCIFFVPTIVSFVNSVLGDLGVNYVECMNGATLANIEEKINDQAKEAVSVAKVSENMSDVLEAETYVNKMKDSPQKEEYLNTLASIKQGIIDEEKQKQEEEENQNQVTPSPGGESTPSSGGNTITSGSTSEEVIGDGNSTGYLKSPINPSATHAQYISSIQGNSKTLYYLAGGYHGGTDLPVVIGTSVYAMDGGTVFKVQDGCGSYGRHIILEHVVNNKKYYTIYAHLSEIKSEFLKTGTKVSQGQLIAKSGNSYHCTGQTTVGAHLHLGISYNSNGSFPQTVGDNSFLAGNFVGLNISYSIVDSSNLEKYKTIQY